VSRFRTSPFQTHPDAGRQVRHLLHIVASKANHCYAMKRNAFQILAGVLFFALVETTCAGTVALPDFSVIGQRWGQAAKASNNESPEVFPKQVTIDYNANGVIYGLAYEYKDSKEAFDELKAEIQKTIRVEPIMYTANMVAWRNEDRKLTITLTLDKETKSIKVIAVSIDKNIRRD
jgi:hypothetical protein